MGYVENVKSLLREVYPQGEEEIDTGIASVHFFIPDVNLCVMIDQPLLFYGDDMQHELYPTSLKYHEMK